MACENIKIAETICQLINVCISKKQLTESLFIIGGHSSIIERFFQLNPDVAEIRLLGNNVVLLNDSEIELCYAKELERYVQSANVSMLELKILYDIFEQSHIYESLIILIAKKIISYDPQLI